MTRRTRIVHPVSGIVVNMPIIAYIGLGSNMGDKKANAQKALELLSASCCVKNVSSLYSTEPVGYEKQERFVNAVAEIETDLSPQELLSECNRIEDALGRSRDIRWGPRTIDLDILLYGDQVVDDPTLEIPHPRMGVRGFVLIPLCEIAPEARHPVIKKTVKHLLHELRDEHKVVKCC